MTDQRDSLTPAGGVRPDRSPSDLSVPSLSRQEASLSVWLQFSDDTASLLSSFAHLPHFLQLSSLAETVVVVTPGPGQRILAQGDGGGPLLRAELLVTTCDDPPITSNSIGEGEIEWTDEGWTGTGMRTESRRLGGGSGWIRVNMDLGFALKNDQEAFDFDFSDTLVEPDGDIYTSNFEENSLSSDERNKAGKRKWKEAGEGRAVRWDNLERAVLIPNQEAGGLHFSPSQEKIGERKEEEEEGKEEGGVRELEAGLGALLSLLCLFAVLFLANCLPCALRDRRKAGREDGGEEEPRGGGEEGEETERNEARRRDEDEEIKEVEIIC